MSFSVADVFNVTNVGNVTQYEWSNIILHPGSTYFISVSAINSVQLYSDISSIEFVVDDDAPMGGSVYTSGSHSDVSFVSSDSTLTLSWHGFRDNESGIKGYHVTIVEEGQTPNNFISVGRLSTVTLSDLKLQHGRRYVSVVRAEDGVGRMSDAAMSSVFLVDTSLPVGYSCFQFEIKTEFIATYVGDVLNVSRDITPEVGLYILSVHSSVTVPEIDLVVSFGDQARHISIRSSQNNTIDYDYTFFNQRTHSNVLQIEIASFNMPGTVVYFTLKHCSSLTTTNALDHRIKTYQTDYHNMDVKLHITDPESGIRFVKLGAGTTKYGYQIQSLTSVVPENHHRIWFDLPHLTPVFVTAIVENHAGGISYFTSDVIHMDHTSPEVKVKQFTLHHNQYIGTFSLTIHLEILDDVIGNFYCWLTVGKY